ncbi:mediator of RNA polymerase II transcription subunit 19-like [Ptychodera flava]|uniref:mediator of RNA polymerase II transcription subunit 19-like n=1 Tax=Ptychodera flava TaxID=63121 RepID=UPI00396A39E1
MEGMKRPDLQTQALGVRSPKFQTVMRQKSPLPSKSSYSSSEDPEPFYLMRDMSGSGEITGETNLVSYHGLEQSYNKFCSKKVKEQLSAFLPNLPGMIDTVGSQDNSSLRSLIEKQPILGKEFIPLSGPSLAGFRLHPGPIPEQYRLMHQQPQKRKHKHKKPKKEHRSEPIENPVASTVVDASHDKKHKKPKKHEDGEKRKKKKDKKKKKSRHSPEHQGISGIQEANGPGRPS